MSIVCNLGEAIAKKNREEGRIEGREEGRILERIAVYREMNMDDDSIAASIKRLFNLTPDKVQQYMSVSAQT